MNEPGWQVSILINMKILYPFDIKNPFWIKWRKIACEGVDHGTQSLVTF